MVFAQLKKLFMTGTPSKGAVALYGAAVEAARAPVFYTRLGVADTLDGRFDMILLHLFLLVDRLSGLEETGAKAAARDIQEVMVRDMDRSLREMGVGDMSVGKKMKAMGEAWFGRRTAYHAAVIGEAPAVLLSAALARNVFSGAAPDGSTDQLATYVLDVRTRLAGLAFPDISPTMVAEHCAAALEEHLS